MPTGRIRLLVVDDHPIMREGLALVVARDPDFEVVGFASTGEESVRLVPELRPDIVLMDLRLPGMDGVAATREIVQQGTGARIVVLTMYGGDEDIFRALEAGAATYVLKDAVSDDLIDVVRSVHAGERVLSPEIQERLSERATRPSLTPREVDLLRLVLEGRRNKEIAAVMTISEETVEVHLRNIFGKLGVHDRTAAVYVGLRRGIIHLD